jgi:hypothetical protein
MTLAMIAQGVAPLPPPLLAEQPIMLALRFDELDRDARGAVTHRSIEDTSPANSRLRGRANDLTKAFERRRPEDERKLREDRQPRRDRGEFGLHLAIDEFPERVRHSSGFMAQLIAQQFSVGSDSADFEDGAAAYNAVSERGDAILFGVVETQMAFA